MEQLDVTNAMKRIAVTNACVAGSTFVNVDAGRLHMENINLSGTKITDANMSDLEIDGAQLGGAYIHNIGLPPEGHPNYEPGKTQRPLRFENCMLNGSTIADCDLSGVELTNCTMTGLTIDGIPVEELLEAYKKLNR
ncbi:pentapeptide repeat-containing protein [Paenibacillus arenilitoris]|uniref:Pentapeptide repeat-containing protein n=1 Tax=Paenibacillus arenilitoris TaxID=2772299 RepID=A0A927H7Z3_9BACL|nr:pentapeptide repeat-containing protein [Paenibacillus arenilitoris]MBD2871143.1 pentapeptide repeat-containing protein [Paenibacillus arenilitoris]